MYFESLHELINMNGHGVYVWSAYGAGFAVLGGLVWQALARQRVLRQQIIRQLEETP